MPASMPIALSIVVPVYQAEKHIAEFHRRMSQAASSITPDYEIILVNDASADHSAHIMDELAAKDPHLVIIRQPRNMGQIKAIYTGLSAARGALVFTIDDDLEEKPEWLPLFHDTWKNMHCDIVFASQPQRYGNWFAKATGYMTFFVMNRLCGADIVDNVMTCRLLSRHAVDAILANGVDDIPYCLMCYQTGLLYSVIHLQKIPIKPSCYSAAMRCRFAWHYFRCYWRLRHTILSRRQ
jgi:putative glycosyltransferase